MPAKYEIAMLLRDEDVLHIHLRLYHEMNADRLSVLSHRPRRAGQSLPPGLQCNFWLLLSPSKFFGALYSFIKADELFISIRRGRYCAARKALENRQGCYIGPRSRRDRADSLVSSFFIDHKPLLPAAPKTRVIALPRGLRVISFY